jgi:hypothetical protein
VLRAGCEVEENEKFPPIKLHYLISVRITLHPVLEFRKCLVHLNDNGTSSAKWHIVNDWLRKIEQGEKFCSVQNRVRMPSGNSTCVGLSSVSSTVVQPRRHPWASTNHHLAQELPVNIMPAICQVLIIPP